MNEITQFIQCLEADKESSLLQAEILTKTDRKDEADMAKICANIFDIMIAAAHAAEKQLPQSAISFIEEKMETIPKAWQESMSAAEKHNDHQKAAIERIKLQTIAEINEKFTDILETV